MLQNRERRTQGWINRDPWDITVYREGVISHSLVGRLSPAGSMGRPLNMYPSGDEEGESARVRYGWVLVTGPQEDLANGDVLTAVHRATGMEWHFVSTHPRRTPHKVEAIVDERQ